MQTDLERLLETELGGIGVTMSELSKAVQVRRLTNGYMRTASLRGKEGLEFIEYKVHFDKFAALDSEDITIKLEGGYLINMNINHKETPVTTYIIGSNRQDLSIEYAKIYAKILEIHRSEYNPKQIVEAIISVIQPAAQK